MSTSTKTTAAPMSTDDNSTTAQVDAQLGLLPPEKRDAIREIMRSFLHQLFKLIEPDADSALTAIFDPAHSTSSLPSHLFVPPAAVDPLCAFVYADLRAHSIDTRTPVVLRYVRQACETAEGIYPDHPDELKRLIALTTLALIYIDDVLVGKAVSPPSAVLDTSPGSLVPEQNLLRTPLQFLLHTPQDDPVLEHLFMRVLPRMWDHFDPLSAGQIVVGCWEFAAGGVMEGLGLGRSLRKEGIDIENPKGHSKRDGADRFTPAMQFAEFVRLKSGGPAPYTCWIFHRSCTCRTAAAAERRHAIGMQAELGPDTDKDISHIEVTDRDGAMAPGLLQDACSTVDIDTLRVHPPAYVYLPTHPDLYTFINQANDVLSFYKEECAGDLGTYVRARAMAEDETGPDPYAHVLDVLRAVCDETIEATARALRAVEAIDAALESERIEMSSASKERKSLIASRTINGSRELGGQAYAYVAQCEKGAAVRVRAYMKRVLLFHLFSGRYRLKELLGV